MSSINSGLNVFWSTNSSIAFISFCVRFFIWVWVNSVTWVVISEKLIFMGFWVCRRLVRLESMRIFLIVFGSMVYSLGFPRVRVSIIAHLRKLFWSNSVCVILYVSKRSRGVFL